MDFFFNLLSRAQEKGFLSPLLLLFVLAGSIYAQNTINDNLRHALDKQGIDTSKALDKQGTDLKDAISLIQGQIGPIARELAKTADSVDKATENLKRMDENGTLAEVHNTREELKLLREKFDRQIDQGGRRK